MKRKVGVLFDGFDPVNADHLDAALSEARNSGFAIVLMGLQPGKSKESCIDRWRMLVASCSDSRLLVPVMTEQECNADRMKFLQGKYPDDDLVMIGGTEELPSADFCPAAVPELPAAMTVPSAAAGLSLRFAVSAYFLNSNGNEAIFLPSAPLKMLQVPVTVLTGKKSRSLSIFSSAEKSALT